MAEVREHEFAQVNAMLRRFVKEGARGLDVGCAYGWYLKSVKHEFRMEGIEPEAAIAKQARTAGHIVYTGSFPGDMPKEADKYDFIVFNNVWEHINHTPKLIEGCIAFLKEKGVIAVTVPLSTGGLYKMSELFEKFGRTKELARLWQLHFHSPHVYYFNKENIRYIMERYGFELIACEDVWGGIEPKRMKERFEMDIDEKYGKFKSVIFQAVYPVLKRFPADKAVFVFLYTK